TAPLYILQDPLKASEEFRTGSILVCEKVTRQILPLVRKSAGLILEDPDPESQGVVAGISLDIPVLIGAGNATHILKSGAVVTLDASDGTVTCN
ncbi:MAG: pyruvate kinase, partial [Clostridia bacterium]|nr:pyruvate kinase [Clostridia bacterium]